MGYHEASLSDVCFRARSAVDRVGISEANSLIPERRDDARHRLPIPPHTFIPTRYQALLMLRPLI